MSENEINNFKVKNATAVYEDGSLRVRMYYPAMPEPLTTRLPQQLEFGVGVFQSLLNGEEAQIADGEHPLHPPSAGSLYVFEDGAIVCNRRDAGAPTHPLYHAGYSGFDNTPEHVYSANGLLATGSRETAEECLLITRDETPWLVVPNDSKEETIASAARLGLGEGCSN